MNHSACDCVWTNLRVWPGLPGAGIAEHQAVAWRGERIEWIGPSLEAPDAVQVIDGGGRLATPGLIDCHTHLVYAGDRAGEWRQRLEGKSYAEIARGGGGIAATGRAVRASDADTLFEQSAPRLRSLIRSGVTTVEIKSGYGLDTPSEERMLSVARRLGQALDVTVATTFLGAHTVPPDALPDAYIDSVCDEQLPAVANAGLADAVDGFCETIAFSTDQIERVFVRARELGLPVKLHAEQLSDSGGALMAARHGALSCDHLEYLSEAGARARAATGTVAVLLPGAFYFLGETRRPPVDLLRALGVPIAVATDLNPGSSPLRSPLLAMNMACTLFGLTPEESLTGMTSVAARALGQADQRGTLEAGKYCDMAVWDVADLAGLMYELGHAPLHALVRHGRRLL